MRMDFNKNYKRVLQMDKTRLLLSLKRWWDLVLYSLLTVLLYEALLTLPSGARDFEMAGTLVALLVAGQYFFSVFSVQKIKQINQSWSLALWRPPTFFAVPLVLLWKQLPIFDDFFKWFDLCEILLTVKNYWADHALSELALQISMVAIIVAVVLKVVSSLSDRKLSPTKAMRALAVDIEDLSEEQIIDWINEEKPVGESLFFGRQMYVNRIYDLIISKKSEGKRIALVGGFGNGKSSVIQALQNELRKNQSDAYIFVRVDCWGRDPETIEQQILSLVIDKLGEVTDITGYKRIPENFQRALQDQGGWLSSISHLISSGIHDAQAMLSRVDRLLTLLNKRLLLIIEDPDRGEEDQVRIRTDRIASLMDRLGFGTTPNIGFIFCLSPNGHVTGDDLIRVCEYREDLDDLADEFIPLLNKICSKIWENQPGTIYPNDPIVFEKSDLQFDSIREFKNTIRTVDYLWRKTDTHNGPLHGEIDLYELALLSLAKEYHQSLFTNLESLLSDRKKDHYKWCTHQKNGRVKRYTDDLINKRESVNQRLLIDQLLTPKRQYQVCASNGRTDYLQRFLRRGLMAGEKSDQDILRGLNKLVSSIDGYQTDAEDDRELVQNLICCGSLSPWYYGQLDKLNNPRLAYIRTAQKLYKQ